MTGMNGTNGNCPTLSSLDAQQQRDLYRLMMHFQHQALNHENEDTRSVALEAPQPLHKRRIAPTPSHSRMDDDDVTVHTSNVTKRDNRSRTVSWIRAILLDLPLAAVFVCLTTIYCADIIYHEYYVPMFELSTRTLSNANLRKEYTYYDRECTLYDMSSQQGEGLVLHPNMTAAKAVDSMMTHGTALIPKMLNVQTARELRKYIMSRNNALTKDEKIPLSQGKNRASFGIDATEAPIVSEALRQVANHLLFQGLIQGLVGQDPALTEITAITAWPGAPHQAWHQDVKADGSAIKFARTFSHSYSLFIALQDTTEEMGATTLCPGTHFCTNDIADICDKNGFPLNSASPGGVWHTGDGALLNQQVWHRGGKHADHSAPERVVFIVSFIGRPDATRQLARGTYFHQKWLSWGHTMQDLGDAHRSMAKPFSILRALSLWKPKSRNWGYDFITSAVMRIANLQMGVAPDELPNFKTRVIENIFHVPSFLQGPVNTNNDSAWQDYLVGTIRNLKKFFLAINVVILALYIFAITLICINVRSVRPIKSASYRMLFTHAVPILLAWRVMHGISNSEWKHRTGDFLRPPFPQHLASVEDDSISAGPTTLPTNLDILVGSRFDAMYLGVYERWLDYHPGNVEFRAQIDHCSHMPTALDEKCVKFVLDTKRGHVLQQDWRSGYWRIMTPLESRRHVRTALKMARYRVVDRMAKSLAILLAYNRFDVPPTSMSFKSIEMLKSLQDKMFAKENALSSEVTKPATRKVFSLTSSLPRLPTPTAIPTMQARTPEHPRWMTSRPKPDPFRLGDIVWINYKGRGEFFKGAVMGVRESDGALDIAYVDSDRQHGVPLDLAMPEVPLVENGYVMHHAKKSEAQILRVKPNGWVDIRYPNGATQQDIKPAAYTRLVT